MKKYKIIFKDLERAIYNQDYQVDDFLPTETELAKQYQVSRDTIRKALDLLVQEGLVKKKHGSGSQVLKHEQIDFPVSELTSYQELMDRQGITSKTHVISIDRIITDKNLAKKTGFSPNQQVWRVIRQRVVEGSASVLDIDYLDCQIVPDLSRTIAEKSIYAYLENELQLSISHALKEITIAQTTDQDQLLLDLGKDPYVVCICSQVFLENGQQFQYTESRHKLEKFRFVDYARRHP